MFSRAVCVLAAAAGLPTQPRSVCLPVHWLIARILSGNLTLALSPMGAEREQQAGVIGHFGFQGFSDSGPNVILEPAQATSDTGISGSAKDFIMRLLWFMFFVSRKHERDDFEIGISFAGKAERAAAFLKIDQALDLISTFDPERYQQIKKDVKKILIIPVPPDAARWIGTLQMCVIDTEYFFRANISPTEIAGTIVHEATHAHLGRLEMKHTTEEARAQIERMCTESQIAFAKRLPEPGSLNGK